MRWLIPPYLWVACLLAVGVVAWAAPEGGLFAPPWRWLGVPLVAGGLWLLLTASSVFKKRETNIHTFKDPDVLVTEGAFAYSRNPMYLGFLLVLAGAGVLASTAWALFPAVVFFLAAQFWYIPFEERSALARFGDSYLSYRQRVRRWL